MFTLLKTQCNLTKLKLLANKVAEKTTLGDILLLKGDLGTGKTTFTRFYINEIFIRNLCKKPTFIKSPSFPIMINYNVNNFEIFHYDLYRVKNSNEINELNIFENIKNNITLIEWPELIYELLPIKNFFIINFKILSKNKREIEIQHSKKHIFIL